VGGMDRKHERAGFLRLGYCARLYFHPHIHCVIPGGGLARDHSQWVHSRRSFFLPVKVLGKVFRGKFVAGLRKLFRKKRVSFSGQLQHMAQPRHFAAFLRTLFRQNWVVYAKPPFGGPEQVLRYLGRYTHRVAISNHRLLSFDGNDVTFVGGITLTATNKKP
jgi:hypothetical protein